MKPRSVLSSLLLLVPLFVVPAQRLHEVSVRRIAIDNYPHLRLFVSAKDISLQSLVGLTVHNFKLQEDGQDVTVDSVASARELKLPVSCIVAVDVSGSMAKDQRIENAKVVATDFVRRLEVNDRVALIAFGTQVSLVSDFTTDRGALEVAIASFKPEETGYTHLYDALYQSQKLALSQSTERKVIVILTDGKDEGSFLKEDDIIAESQKSNLPVYAMGFGVQADIAERILGRIATLTGGAYQYAMNYQELSAIFARLSDDLRNEYVVAYETSLAADGQLHDVSLSVTVGDDRLAAVRKFETPIISGFWTLRRMVLVFAVLLLLIIFGIYFWRWRKAEKIPKETGERPSDDFRQRDAIAPSVSVDDETSLMERPTATMESDKTRVLGNTLSVRAWFVLRGGKLEGKELLVDVLPATIGRAAKADVRIQDETVSAQHAKLFIEESTIYINDLASTNGTFVSGLKIGRTELHDNDKVRFGDVETVFKYVSLTNK